MTRQLQIPKVKNSSGKKNYLMKKKTEKCATYFIYSVENQSVGSRSLLEINVLIMHRTFIPEVHFITADTASICVSFLSGLGGLSY